jgi:hypothetical protein
MIGRKVKYLEDGEALDGVFLAWDLSDPSDPHMLIETSDREILRIPYDCVEFDESIDEYNERLVTTAAKTGARAGVEVAKGD